MRYDDRATREAAWQLLCQAAEQRGQTHMVAAPETRAAFVAGWEAHKDAVARVNRERSD